MKIRLAVANTKQFEYLGEPMQLSDEALQRLADTAPGLYVLREFDYTSGPVGTIESADVENGVLYVTINFSAEHTEVVGSAVAPAFDYPGYKATDFGLTKKPVIKDADRILN